VRSLKRRDFRKLLFLQVAVAFGVACAILVEWSTSVSTILNLASACFFLSEVVKLHRRWHARFRMDSTSLEGTVMHIVGNSLIGYAGYVLVAWVTFVTELFLAVLGVVTLCWKLRWLWRNFWGVKKYQ